MAAQIKPPTNPQLPAPAPVPPQEPEEGKVMSFFEHLDELRDRIIRAAAAVLVGFIISLVFTDKVLVYISATYGERLALLNPTDSVVAFFRVALMLGAMLAMPVITYQLFMFIMPGLTRRERRWVFMALPGTTALFIVGVVFTWVYLIPLYIRFLSGFQQDVFQTVWTADSYITFVTTVLFWHGVAFETPVVFYVLARMGFVTARSMIGYWRHAIVIAAVLAAIITPTIDPITMSAIMSVLLTLYVASIVLVFFAVRLNRKRLAGSPTGT